jgi:RNA polymerase-interacting CarD/CdnL/TRCF family regulator
MARKKKENKSNSFSPTPKKPFKVGEKIIDFGQACEIFAVKSKDKEAVIHFRPFFKSRARRHASYSIPVKNITKTNLRRPITKRQLRKLFRILAKKPKVTSRFNIARGKKLVNLNNPFKTAKVVKRLWLDKQSEKVNFTKTRKDLFRLAMKRLVEEVALVSDTDIDEAKEKIEETLKKIA